MHINFTGSFSTKRKCRCKRLDQTNGERGRKEFPLSTKKVVLESLDLHRPKLCETGTVVRRELKERRCRPAGTKRLHFIEWEEMKLK